MEYLIGQRWVSHADAQLGLGVVVEVEPRRITLSFPAVGEERTYAIDNAPLTRLRFKEGDHINTVEGVELIVTDVAEQHGLLMYTGTDHHEEQLSVSELELDAFVQLTTPQQRLLNGHFDKNGDFALRVATMTHVDRLQRSPARGLMGSRTSLLHHQLYIANEVGQRHAPRVLLADEVGLGKTIEAGMIIHQQLLTGRASRVLVLLPPSLMHQWLVEMLRRFNLHFALFDIDRLSQMTDGNPFEAEQLVLCSLEMFEDNDHLQQLALAAGWDLVVVDEAHHLHWSEEQAGEDYRFVEALAQSSPGLLLLTATPEQIGQASHFARLRLLDPSRFHDLQAFQEQEREYRQMSDMADTLESGTIPDNLPADLDRNLAPTELVKQLLDRHGTGRVLFRNTRAAVEGFPQRVLHRYPLPAPEQYVHAQVELEERLHPELPYYDESWLDFDPRVEWLVQTLKKLRPEKVLVICAHATTAVALEHYLHMRAGIRSSAFYEGLSIIERDRAAAYFADEVNGAQTLVCSEIGSEGRNFQFAHHLILFDLPANPDLLEQRIGRLDRMGQQHDVEIHVPYLQDTPQETLVDWYDRGLDVFRDSCSAGTMILETFRERLKDQLDQRTEAFDELLVDTAEFTNRTREELRDGRDRLIERNSCRRDVADALIEEINALEAGDTLENYLEALCEAFGVDQEFHSEHTLVLRPSEHMLTGHFPYVNDEGTTVTFDREKALSREDMEFITWEHPMIHEAMDMVHSTELGNAAIGTIKLKGVPAGTMLLEALYTVNCVAPKALQVERFLPLTPMRLLVDARGKELAALVPHERLNTLIERVKKPTALAIIKQVHREVDAKMSLATAQAEARLQDILKDAESQMRSQLGAELARLEALREVNPSIREEELDNLRYRIEECAVHITHANLQLQALRLIITT
ncbi:RNA polymerase-binding ATPase [Halioglobus japonicus]|uniref:RNA polymerase-associated protein RapA n=1 Tax=Halioglobus japonicus TaxID=930805 RepID=A0AAP8SP97_9GAMM|nr:RNA polymerase-associated protein RapA [Halioglobus japonicus]AQA19476.1 RNA polymerase-binding ATPase [Halioglobus japonicus]PLW87467.1 RNA polymerase-associated protein RapA [Halioglobus japonicus]GHD08317.1 RNA polymerase-associated protein RapA [Halioglobus japonicus]